MILAALDQAGGVDYLVRQADESPAAFLTLIGKVLPMQIQGSILTRTAQELTNEQLAIIAAGGTLSDSDDHSMETLQ